MADLPDVKSLSHPAHNLPMQPTPFIGREQEVRSVCALLRRPEVRLVTLTGPGGMGKTWMALQVAAALSDSFADGVFLVPLAPVSEPGPAFHIDIDEGQLVREVAEITESDFFQHLLQQAQHLRSE
jgi:hypothetical protein